ncbi:hypothetical protein PIB30_024645 [Stylosanthes scabra]|uniref:Uncharacterized protein n=1 Tax=Stylosanthes scabra TaxID=79078 RepID=A0ABU6X9W8_9FABA|nr:hypothetical protein [Stylosanthes scabra]
MAERSKKLSGICEHWDLPASLPPSLKPQPHQQHLQICEPQATTIPLSPLLTLDFPSSSSRNRPLFFHGAEFAIAVDRSLPPSTAPCHFCSGTVVSSPPSPATAASTSLQHRSCEHAFPSIRVVVLQSWQLAMHSKRAMKRGRCRLKLLKNKREAIATQLRKDVVELVHCGHNETALNRVEQLIEDESLASAYELLGLVYASARCGEIPELCVIRKLFRDVIVTSLLLQLWSYYLEIL